MENRGKGIGKASRVIGLLALCLSLAFPVSLFPRSPVYPPGSGDSTPVSTLTREGRLAVFDDVWSTVNERYYDHEFHGLDWKAQRETFRSLAADAKSSQEFYGLLRRMIGVLNDPHTRVFAPEEKFDWWRPRFVTIGVSIREVDDRATVVQVEKDSSPERAGIRAGDVIDTVNGEPALSLMRDRLANLPAPVSLSTRARVFSKLLDGPAESFVQIGWWSKDGKEKSAQFQRHWQQRELGLRVHQKSGGFAVIEIDAFTRSIASALTRTLKEKLKGSKGVVLDLRNNGGGDAQVMAAVASAFLKEGSSLGQFISRSGSVYPIFTWPNSQVRNNRNEQPKLPLVVLTSERSASAAEILVAALKSSRRARIIGGATCGCVLAIRTRHELPDGGLLDVSELDYQTARGERLEGRGVNADERVVTTRDDLYSGRDRALELALNELTRVRASLN